MRLSAVEVERSSLVIVLRWAEKVLPASSSYGIREY